MSEAEVAAASRGAFIVLDVSTSFNTLPIGDLALLFPSAGFGSPSP
jgi:hypothetical protein